MASRCVSAISAISALHPSIAARGEPRAAIEGFRSDIADTHLEAMLYILYIRNLYCKFYNIISNLIERDYKQCQRHVIEDTCQRIAATIHDNHHFGVNRSLDVITAKYY